MGWACGMYGEEQKCILDIGGETWRTHTKLGIPGYRWNDNIKMDLQETV